VATNTYKFGNRIIKLQVDNPVIRTIFTQGLFNPDIIFGPATFKSQTEIDSMSTSESVLYNLIRDDSIIICCFEQLERLNPNHLTKRFSFWVFNIGSANPTEYYIEFKNKKATKHTTPADFFKNAQMTFFYKGTIIM
jgi:hypothetical protein